MRALVLSALLLVPALVPAAAVADAGHRLYMEKCSACHGADGQGSPGVIPTLTSELGALTRSASGREYLMQAVMFGLAGPIKSNGQTYSGAMPAIGQTLPPEDLAALLNYVVEVLNAGNRPATWQAFSAEEVKQLAASARLSPTAVARRRATIDADSRDSH